ncbi:MAG: helix-turn-helix domain-containing protein [Paracoccaceae bacterium]
MSKAPFRLLRLAEILSLAPPNGFTKSEIVDRFREPPSTVYRLLKELQDQGYIYQTADGRLLPAFTFERHIGSGAIPLAQLREACSFISQNLQTAAEIILLRGFNLEWRIIEEHPAQRIRLHAHPGFERTTYELDSISRLSLAFCEIQDIETSLDTSVFHEVGVHQRSITWEQARANLLSIDRDQMQFDMLGNAMGVRRSCVAIRDPEGQLICLLTAAEAATPVRDEERHVSHIRQVLERARSMVFRKQIVGQDQKKLVGMQGSGH